jgi:hypothetical protein
VTKILVQARKFPVHFQGVTKITCECQDVLLFFRGDQNTAPNVKIPLFSGVTKIQPRTPKFPVDFQGWPKYSPKSKNSLLILGVTKIQPQTPKFPVNFQG